ncbi:PhzF family phenazine biosynthesis protein [Phenylobacterium sp.]|jgi:PhzF family phenazine biosynthesis protein|uniref:PhzF family phenazine biosynthesis protein n=1 Tax=Phenylobacterium sp. TaxID=1871053 RepID=UPI002F95F6E5
MSHPCQLVDVFGLAHFSGNPVAVFANADGLETEAMQQITRWMNLSESTFLLRPTSPDADYRVRIFTLDRELPFAGHPTLGTCHAWLEAGGKPRHADLIVQECAVGLVAITRDAGQLAFAAPPLVRSDALSPGEVAEIANVLRIDPSEIVDSAWVDNGPGWRGVMLKSAEAVLALEPDRSHTGRIEIGVIGPHAGGDVDYEVRAFFTDQFGGMLEDPVTGSLNASLAQWLFASGRARGSYVAAQGARLGRTGRVRLRQDANGQVWVSGRTVSLITGQAPDLRL